MAQYRVYIIGRDGHFQDFVPLDCADDDAAMEQAKQLANGYEVELWQYGRKIAKFDHKSEEQRRNP
jgi:hypothetical protein